MEKTTLFDKEQVQFVCPFSHTPETNQNKKMEKIQKAKKRNLVFLYVRLNCVLLFEQILLKNK